MTSTAGSLPELVQGLRASKDGPGILIVRFGAMGDIVRTVPPLRLLRRALPDAQIHWVLEQQWQVLLEGHPDLDSIVSAPRKDWNRFLRSPFRWPELASSIARFRRQLRELRPDLVLDFHGNLRSGLAGAMSGARVRVGYAGVQQKEGNRWFTTHRIAVPDRRAPRMERNLALIRGLGLPDGPLPPADLPLVEHGTEDAARLLAGQPRTERGFAVVAAGVSRKQGYKKPPAELLAAACERLSEARCAPLVVYGPDEEPDARRVVELAPGRARLAPPTGLPLLAALLARARLFVGGDTGPMHLACAAGCPVLAIYGPTDPRVNEPWGVPFRALSPPGRRYTGIKRQDRGAGSFEGLGVDAVQRAIDELLAESRAVG